MPIKLSMKGTVPAMVHDAARMAADPEGSAAPAIGRHALVWQPQPLRRLACLPEDVDRDAAARIPIAADAQIMRRDQGGDGLGDPQGAVLMEGAMIAEAAEIELERLRFDEPLIRHIVDDQYAEIGLAGDRAERGEFRTGEAGEIIRARLRIG